MYVHKKTNIGIDFCVYVHKSEIDVEIPTDRVHGRNVKFLAALKKKFPPPQKK